MTDSERDTDDSTSPGERSPFADGAVCGVGSLPHRDAAAAAAFAIGEFDIATIPTLPTRSPAETMIAQAVVGVPGVSLGQYGSFAVDPSCKTDDMPVKTDLAHDAFAGVRAFLELAPKVRLDGAPVKWQFVGPVTLGVALRRAGLESDAAFSLAVRAVRSHLSVLSSAITDVLPSSPQLVMLDEPWLDQLMAPDFPIPPDEAIDLMSSGMAALAQTATVGIHCCSRSDIATMLASGPEVISVPVSDDLVDWAGYIARFVAEGGVIAWGAVPTEGPVGASADRHWRTLSDLWCSLVQRGCDPVTLRRQSMITPSCGLATHSVSVARRLARQTSDVSKRVKDQAGATRFALGA
jgi:hypothetical protein